MSSVCPHEAGNFVKYFVELGIGDEPQPTCEQPQTSKEMKQTSSLLPLESSRLCRACTCRTKITRLHLYGAEGPSIFWQEPHSRTAAAFVNRSSNALKTINQTQFHAFVPERGARCSQTGAGETEKTGFPRAVVLTPIAGFAASFTLVLLYFAMSDAVGSWIAQCFI